MQNIERDARWVLLSISGAILVALAIPWRSVADHDSDRSCQGIGGPVPAALPVASNESTPPAQLGAVTLDKTLNRYVAPLGDGQATLTMIPSLQAKIEKVMADYRVPWGATVMLEPGTGRVLALAEHSQREPEKKGLCFRAAAPAASIFKIVTSAALLGNGIDPLQEVCFHGGHHKLKPKLLADDPRRDRNCLNLGEALGRSANVVFAKLADRDLSQEQLQEEAARFLFNAPIPFAQPIDISTAQIPADAFELASTAAGFGPVRLSPIHGALIAAIVANNGLFVPPDMIESTEGADEPELPKPYRVVSENIANSLAGMLQLTVTEGTARRFFRARRNSPLREVKVAGKTGSLNEKDPFRDYSWFVGFAPAENPRVVVSTVIVNERLWRVKAPAIANEALKAYFAGNYDERATLAAGR